MKAERMFEQARDMVETLGIDSRRIRLAWVSSAEANRFAEVAQDFTRTIQSLGPANLIPAARTSHAT
jgi:F420-non-reducing hydrogenase iron-sulfur subunit